jgi:hypothetical protein
MYTRGFIQSFNRYMEKVLTFQKEECLVEASFNHSVGTRYMKGVLTFQKEEMLYSRGFLQSFNTGTGTLRRFWQSKGGNL